MREALLAVATVSENNKTASDRDNIRDPIRRTRVTKLTDNFNFSLTQIATYSIKKMIFTAENTERAS
jgi:hypothetical protein